MQAVTGVIKVVVGPGRCPAIEDDGGRCKAKATQLTEVKTRFGSTYIRACLFHADMMEDE